MCVSEMKAHVRDTGILTETNLIEDVRHLHNILEALGVKVALFAEFFGVFAGKFEGHVSAQNGDPMVNEDLKGPVPLFHLCTYNTADVSLNSLFGVSLLLFVVP